VTETRTPIAEGGCQCGAVRYALYVTPQKPHACHCRMCQRAVGGLFAAFVGAPPADFAWTKGAPAIFASSNIANRGFCAACGTPLTFEGTYPESKRIYVTIGSLDHPERTPIAEQVGMESHIPWVHFNEELPQRRTGEAYDPAAAAAWTARIRSNQG
jgi:hypothetical protein